MRNGSARHRCAVGSLGWSDVPSVGSVNIRPNLVGDSKPRIMLDQVLVGHGRRSSRPLSSGHRCRSNLWVKYRSAATASLANRAGVKNLRSQFVHEAIAGTLPSYLKTTKRRSAMWHRSKWRAILTSSRMLRLRRSTARSRAISQPSTNQFCESWDG